VVNFKSLNHKGSQSTTQSHSKEEESWKLLLRQPLSSYPSGRSG